MSAAVAMLEYEPNADIAKINAAPSGNHACLEILSIYIENSFLYVVVRMNGKIADVPTSQSEHWEPTLATADRTREQMTDESVIRRLAPAMRTVCTLPHILCGCGVRQPRQSIQRTVRRSRSPTLPIDILPGDSRCRGIRPCRQRQNEFVPHTLARDTEMIERAPGSARPTADRRDLDGAERVTYNSGRRYGAQCADYFLSCLSPFAASWMLSPAFSICCPAFSTALSISLPACSAGPSCFWQPDSAASNAPMTKAALTVSPSFIICISWWPAR